MHRTSLYLRLIGGLSGTIALLAGGCPSEGTFPPTGAPTPPPGRYWIAERDGELYYFDLPGQRGDSAEWVALRADDPHSPAHAWYLGEGLYEQREDLTWTLIELAPSVAGSSDANATDALTLDELLQLHDPPPPY